MSNPPRRSPSFTDTVGSFARPSNGPAPPSAYREMRAIERQEAAEAAPDAALGLLSPAAMAVQQAPVAAQMEAELFRETFGAFSQAPKSNPVAQAAHYVTAAFGVLGLIEQVQYVGIAALTAPLAAVMPALPVQTLGSMGLGITHTHVHPPSTTPPAPPCPMPSLGAVLLPGSLTVLAGGRPVARAGDVGIILTCVSFGPPFEIMLGSSNTLCGGNRAARVGPDIFFHDNPGEMSGPAIAMFMVSQAAAAVGAIGQAAGGNFAAAGLSVAQMAADRAALAMKMLRRVDPGAPPDFGAILDGDTTVLVGGLPMPVAFSLADIMGKIQKGLAARAARRARANGDEGTPGRAGRGEEPACVGGGPCPPG